MATQFKRGQLVTYSLEADNGVEAIVRRLHRDGSITVEARFFMRGGETVPGYLGYQYRMRAKDLRAA